MPRRRNVWQHAARPSTGPTEKELEAKRRQLQQTPTRDQMERLAETRRKAAHGILDEEMKRAVEAATEEAKQPRRRPGRPVSTRTCSLFDCGKKHHAKGLCHMHYTQKWRALRQERQQSSK